ncbi:MAG: hypothetical protein Q8P29_00600 [Candidatus Levybacteria bacterium]|nr:hypothetical protein [Candidatus Levybacteria bacterium]MDZ4228503.1 hypothetical protein [Candidatus Levybacteria bacterium]
MSILNRYPNNPILEPNPQNPWESFAVFNGSIIKKGNNYNLFYRAMGEEQIHFGKKLRLSTIGKATSLNGVNFKNRQQFIKPDYEWEKYGCEDPRIVKIDDKYLIFYTALANYPPNDRGIRVAVAISNDLLTISEKHLITPFNAKAMVMFPEKINNLYTVILTINTDIPPSHIAIAQFEKFSTLWDINYWNNWYENYDKHLVNLRRINSDQVEIGATPLKTDYGWILIYSYIKHYLSDKIKTIFRIEAALLDTNDPRKIIGRIETPLLTPKADYEIKGQTADIVFPEGAIIDGNNLKVYYGAADSCCALAGVDMHLFITQFEINSPTTLECEKFIHNPLLEPIAKHEWENKAVFNPGAIEIEGKVYLIYRAVSEKNISCLGLAVSDDGIYIDERLPEPIYPSKDVFEQPDYRGSVEDPRLTLIGKILYMCYTAYDGKLPRLAMSSIAVEDFLKRNWSSWSLPKIISPPGVADKDGVLFPEKINGKYVFFHRIEPNITIDMVDDLEFSNNKHLTSKGFVLPRTGFWDAVKIGVNNPPIKTDCGWLVFYHGISRIDRHYRIGALLLDINDPTKVISRTPYPILEPEAYFEKEGIVSNVVFPCGHIIKGDEIYIYYGGADKVVCGAKINIKELLDYLKKSNRKKYLFDTSKT